MDDYESIEKEGKIKKIETCDFQEQQNLVTILDWYQN